MFALKQLILQCHQAIVKVKESKKLMSEIIKEPEKRSNIPTIKM